MAAPRVCANPHCGRELSGLRPQAVTCSHRCRQTLYRRTQPRREELIRAADAARSLIAAGGIDPLLALSLVVDPTPGVREALEAVAA